MKPTLFHDSPKLEPRIESWLPALVFIAALFILAIALLFTDVFLGWTADLAKAASGKVGSGR